MLGYAAADRLGRDRPAGADYRWALRPRSRAAGARFDPAIGFLVGLAAPLAFAIQGGGYDIVAYETTGLVLWSLIAVALALGLLPRARAPRTIRLPAAGMLALIAWTALSLLWTESQEATFGELARLLVYTGVGVLALTTLHHRNWRAAAGGLATAAAVVSLLAIASRLDPGLFAGTSASIVILGRLAYPLGYWNALGAWSAMSIVLALGWSGYRAASTGRRLALAVVPALGLCLYLTYSRGALIGLAVGLAVLFAVHSDRRELVANAAIGLAGAVAAVLIAHTQPAISNSSGGQGGGLVLVALVALGAMCVAFADALARRRIGLAPWRRAALVAVAVAAVALVVGAKALAPGDLPASTGTTPGTVEAPGTTNPGARVASVSNSRLTMWHQAVDAFASNPALGIGPGAYGLWWNRHVGNPPINDAHSLYLGTLAELGLPGLFALGALILGLLAAAVLAVPRARGARSVIAGLLAAALVFCVQAAGDWLWKVPAIVALAAGAAIAVVALASEPSAPEASRWRAAALAIAALAAGAVMVPGIVSTQLSRDSSTLVSAGDATKAIGYARTAVDAQPWSASAHAVLSSAELAAGNVVAARAAAERAIELEPDNWVYRLGLGIAEKKAGDDRAALQSFRESAVLHDESPDSITPATVRRGTRQLTGAR